MKPEANFHYFAALFISAVVIWLVGPLFLSFLFDAVLTPGVPGKFVPPTQVKAVWNDTLIFIGAIGWIFTLGDLALHGRTSFLLRRVGRGRA